MSGLAVAQVFTGSVAAIFWIVGLVVAGVLLASAVKVLREYERGVLFYLGRVRGEAIGPGLVFIIPIINRMVRVDLRTVTMDVPPQDLITRDNVPARVNAVIYFRVVAPNRSIIEVEDFRRATSQIAQTTLRSVLGQKELDDLLANREAINQELQEIIDEQTDPWGIKVSAVEIKDVEIPQQMQRAMARQAESERERRAKIIAAEGEFQASDRLRQAADRLSTPTAVQLRLFQTLVELSSEQSFNTLIPIPIDLLGPFTERGASGAATGLATARANGSSAQPGTLFRRVLPEDASRENRARKQPPPYRVVRR